MMMGEVVFSPISHSHVIAKENDLSTDWKYWKEHCESFISVCKEIHVIKADGWKDSTGVREEIKIAEKLNIPIKYTIKHTN